MATWGPGSSARCVAPASSPRSLGLGGYPREPLLALDFICPPTSACCLFSPSGAVGRSVPSLTYLQFISQARDSWGTGRPPGGKGLAVWLGAIGRRANEDQQASQVSFLALFPPQLS
jgi:hypothetical protein